MKPKKDLEILDSPLCYNPESVDEEHLLRLLEVFIAAGILTENEIKLGWKIIGAW